MHFSTKLTYVSRGLLRSQPMDLPIEQPESKTTFFRYEQATFGEFNRILIGVQALVVLANSEQTSSDNLHQPTSLQRRQSALLEKFLGEIDSLFGLTD